MFTRNFYALLFRSNNSGNANFSPTVTTRLGNTYNYQTNSGTYLGYLFQANPDHAINDHVSSAGTTIAHIRVGSGSKELSLFDYRLDNDVSDLLEWSSISTSANKTSLSTVHTFTLTNQTDNDIIIREYGIYTRDSIDNWNVYADYLMIRELFPVPITIKPGESAVVNVVLQFPN